MSLTGALSSAISALSAQSQSLSMISDNIANTSTTGYKTTSAMFDDLVTASSNATSYASGGVTVSGRWLRPPTPPTLPSRARASSW
jgi:flagellar hook protein FlgE